MLRVNVTCSYNIVVEEHELEAGSEAEERGHCDGCLEQDQQERQNNEDGDCSCSVSSEESDAEYCDEDYSDCFSTSSDNVDNSLAIVPYGHDAEGRRRRRGRHVEPAACLTDSEEADQESMRPSSAGESSQLDVSSLEQDTCGRHRRRRQNRSGRHQCIQGEVVLGQPTVMYRTQPQQLSGPAAAAASAAAAAVAAASGPSQRIVVQAAARAAAAAAANSAAQENDSLGSQRHSSLLSSAGDSVTESENVAEGLEQDGTPSNQAHEIQRRPSLSSEASSTHSDQDPFFSREALRRAEEEIRAELDAQAASNLDAELAFHSMRASMTVPPPADSRSSYRGHIGHRTFPVSGRFRDDHRQSCDSHQASAACMDFWDTPTNGPLASSASQALDRPGMSAGSVGSVERYLEADLAALQKEASILDQLRFHESIRQQMTLPEDIAQAGPRGAATAVVAGGTKCLFGRRAQERLPRPPSTRRTPLYGRRAHIASSTGGRRVFPASLSLDSAAAIQDAADGEMPPLVRGASNYMLIDTPHLMEMRGGAQVLIVDRADPLQGEMSQEEANSSAAAAAKSQSHMDEGGSCSSTGQQQTIDWGAYRPAPEGNQQMSRGTKAEPPPALVDHGRHPRLGDAPSVSGNPLRAVRRRQQVGLGSNPKMAGRSLRMQASTHDRTSERDEHSQKLPEGRRNHSNLLASSLRLEPRVGAPPVHGRRAAVDGPSSWLQAARSQVASTSDHHQSQTQPLPQRQHQHQLQLQPQPPAQVQHQSRATGSFINAGRRRGALQHSRFTGLNISGHGTRLLGSQHA